MVDESRRQLIDAYAADEMARRLLALGVAQTNTIVLSVLAGAVGAGEDGAR